ncbi:MAG: GNAT family N-acetyltransferase [Pseudomonadota bacterium]
MAQGPTIAIRPVASADAQGLVSMVHGLAAHHGDSAALGPEAVLRDALGEPPWVRVLVAAGAEALVGYAALLPLAKFQDGERGLEIHHLWVEAAHRGQGVGRALIDAAVAEARALGCGSVTIGTHADNHEAQARYLAMGFQAARPPGPRFRLRF